jgi:3-isopropylmalate/(R)-2-methylmalate dehydratase small subunit
VKPFTNIETPAIPLPLANVDTDQIIPARFMTRSRAEGYGPCLLHDFRFDAVGAPRDNPLDDPRRAGAAVLIARRNFGCGSSREAAVYALADFGLRCIVAPSFGDIFASNAVKNGLLPARVSAADAEALLASLAVAEGGAVRIDLEAQTISIGNLVAPFEIDPVWKTQLLHGWDDVDFTLREQSRIDAFRKRDMQARPWAFAGVLDFSADFQVGHAPSASTMAKP